MHLSIQELIDLADGTVAESDRPHLTRCERCRVKLADVRAALTEVAETRVDVPEPSPLFWDHLSARVRAAVENERLPERRPLTAWWSWRLAAPAMALAVLMGLFAVRRVGDPSGTAPTVAVGETAAGIGGVATVDAGAPPADDDPSLTLIADLASDLDWESATSIGLTAGAGALDAAVERMSEAERRTLHEMLEAALSEKGA